MNVRYQQGTQTEIGTMTISEDSNNPLRLDEESLNYDSGLDFSFLWKLITILVGPLLSLLMLHLWSPMDETSELFAVLFWPFFHFIIGLVLSYLEQPKIIIDDQGRILSISDRKKMLVYHIRLVWVLLLTFFEFFGSIYVLAADQGIPFRNWLFLGGLYIIYALAAIVWLKRIKQLKSTQADIKR